VERVQRQIALVPRSGAHHALLGSIHLARRQTGLAETAYLKALELEPGLVAAYVQLGGLYAQTAAYDQALAKLEAALRVNPQNTAALMLTGVIHEQRGEIPKARDAYESVLAINPRFAPAANNLAWLHAEHGGDQERALELAQTAKRLAPDDPYISDTLGWILARRGVKQQALTLLKESATKLPDNMQVQYHLGMTYAQLGDSDNARRALARAASAPHAFPGRDEAKRVLATLR
jgi:tetratricopeptide (TPR) repeat protein